MFDNQVVYCCRVNENPSCRNIRNLPKYSTGHEEKTVRAKGEMSMVTSVNSNPDDNGKNPKRPGASDPPSVKTIIIIFQDLWRSRLKKELFSSTWWTAVILISPIQEWIPSN